MAGNGLSRRELLGAGTAGLALAAVPSWAQSPATEIDAIVARFMSAFELPGIGIAIVRPGQPAFTRGYGVRSLGRPERVDENSLFGIASNTKAFTAAAV